MRSSWQRGAGSLLEFEQEQLNQLIRPAFPRSSVVSWQLAPGGLANTNIRLQLSDRNRPILLRLFTRDPHQATKEWNLNRLVHEHVPSPEFIYLSLKDPFTGHPYILMEWIDGERLEEVLLQNEADDIQSLAASVGAALAAIHSFKFPRAGFFDARLNINKPIELGSPGLIAYAEDCLHNTLAGERLGPALAKQLFVFLKSEAGLLDDWQGRPCLSHCDFNGSNILVQKDKGGWKVSAVLDWEFAFSGSPFFDFGNLLREHHGTASGFDQFFASGYLSAGGELPLKWRNMSLLSDLTSWLDFMTRENPGDNLIIDARRTISQTMENWQP